MKKSYPPQVSIRLSVEDRKIIAAVAKKKGGSLPSVVREAIRVLAAKEEVSFA